MRTGRSGNRWPAVGVFLLLLAVVATAFWPVVAGVETFWFFDVSLFYHPNYALLREAVVSQDLSSVIWNPNSGGGFPQLAEGQIGALYPLNLVLVTLLEPLAAYSIGQVVHYLLAAAFMYLYVRSLGLLRVSAVVAALTFALSGHLVGAMPANPILRSAVWLPLVFWGIERFAQRRKFFYLAVSSLGLAMQVLGGYAATAALGGIAAAVYGMYRLPQWPRRASEKPDALRTSVWRSLPRAVIAIGVFLTIGLSLAAAQLLPLLELVSNSGRTGDSYEFATTWSLPPFHLITLIWPFVFFNPVEKVVWGLENLGRTAIYVGIVPLVLAFVAVLVRRRSRQVVFFACMALVALILAMGRHTPVYRLIYLVPPFRNVRAPSTFGYWFDFAMAALAGYGLNVLLSQPQLRDSRVLDRLPKALLGLMIPILGWQIAVYWWTIRGDLAHVLEPFRQLLKPRRDPALLLRSIGASADPSQLTALLPLVLLTAAAGWLVLYRRRFNMRGWAWIGVGLVVVDLVFFAANIRETQTASCQAVTTRSWAVDVLKDRDEMGRTAVVWGLYNWYDSHQPNRLMVDGVSVLQVYTPLATRWISRYLAEARQNPQIIPQLLAMGNVNYVVDAEIQEYAGIPFSTSRPLAEAGLWRNREMEIALPSEMPAERVTMLFSRTGWPSTDSEDVAQVGLLGSDNQERLWTLLNSSHPATDSREVSVSQVMDGSIFRDPYSWRAEDLSVQEPQLLVAEIELATSMSLTRIRIAPENSTNLYLLALEVESTEGRWVAGDQPFSQEDFELVYRQERGAIYYLDSGLPRAYVVHQVQAVSDQEALELVSAPSFEPHSQAVVSGASMSLSASQSSGSSVRILDYTPVRVDIAAALDSPGLLVLSDAYYPGWRAFVDGVEQPVVRTNYLFRGVFLDEGNHTVTFVYIPMSIRLGIAISLTVAALVVVLLLVELVYVMRRDAWA